MKTFKLTAIETVSIYTDVEAETLEEAIDIATDKEMMFISSNGGQTSKTAWMCDELDGMPVDIRED